VYNPKLLAPKSLAIKIVPTEDMTVEAINPHIKWKLPLAETLAISAALDILSFKPTCGFMG
jgi:hypothetical protein